MKIIVVRRLKPGYASFVPCLTMLIALGMELIGFSTAEAKPEFAAEVGQPCAFCHLDPDGGGPRNSVGQLFESHGFKFPPDFDPTDPEDYFARQAKEKAMPAVRFSLDLRTAYVKPLNVSATDPAVASCQSCHTSQDTFFLMKGELRATAQPHERITLEISNNLGQILDAMAVVEVVPQKLRVRVGQFWLPFGLRQRDHNLLVREGANLGSNRRDVGIELSGQVGTAFYALALVNGRASLMRTAEGIGDRNQHKGIALNVGGRTEQILAGVSAYLNKPGDFDHPATRQMWLAAFARGAVSRLAVEAELNLGGTFGPGQPLGLDWDAQTGDIRSWGYYLGAEARLTQRSRVGLRYEFFDPDRRTSGDLRRRVVISGTLQVLPRFSLDAWYWLHMADPDRPEVIADPAIRRVLEGADQLLLMSRLAF